MTDKEKIRKEVERLQDLTMDENKNFYSEAAEGEYNALCNIEHFIDSLQEEPVSEDLEKVAEEAAVAAFFVSPQWTKTGERLFKAGALWQKQQDSKFPKIWDRETLDEYAYQVAYDLSNDWMKETATWDDVETAVKLGAKWQEERKENG